MELTRVVVVDDHGMVRDGIAAAMGHDPHLEIVGCASSLADAITVVEDARPDVVVCDHQLPDGAGAELPGRISGASGSGDVRVLLVSGAATEATMRAAVRGGCAGFVAKTEGIARLVAAVHDIMADRPVFPIGLLQRVAIEDTSPSASMLTARERDVIALLAEAKGSEEIADELVVSLHTARNHIRNVLAKLGATTRLEAVVRAARLGIVDLSPPAEASAAG